MAISSIPRSVGHNFLPEYQISSIPYIRKTSDAEDIVVNNADGSIDTSANPNNPGADQTVIKRILFPKITSRIQFNATTAVNVYFSKIDALTLTASNSLSLSLGEKTLPLSLRCTALYFNNPANDLEIIAGLTSINSSEFSEVVETFLGDN